MDTFVVRVRESSQSEPGLRGVVDEVASGSRSTFHNHEELLMILAKATPQQATSDAATATAPGTSERVADGSSSSRLTTLLAGIAALLVVFGVFGVGIASADTPVWATGFELGQPTDHQVDHGFDDQNASVGNVDCTSAGNCVAVGFYEDSGEDRQAMIETESDGTWTPTKLALPSNAYPTVGDQVGALDAVTCTSLGNCVAVGNYVDNTPGHTNRSLMVATETNGVWGGGVAIALPAGAASGGDQDGFLGTVSCTAPGDCVAGGSYTDDINSVQAIVVFETAGTWGAATQLVLPAGADTSDDSGADDGDGEQVASVTSFSCPSSGDCIAVGYYNDSAPVYQAMIVHETSATAFGAATEVTLPSVSASGFLGDVTCLSPGNCVAVGGNYHNESSGQVPRLLVLTETNGVWDTGTDVADAPEALLSSGIDTAGFASVSCTTTGNCVATGYETPSSPQPYARIPITADEVNGVWGQASLLDLPSNHDPLTEQYSVGNSVTCTSPGLCIAVGYYGDSSGDLQPVVWTSLPSSIAPLVITNDSLPGAVRGAPYHAQLAATGGSGHYSWSISSDSLPAGLSLDPATGVISGTPTQLGSVAFVVTATDSGPPAQTATAATSIMVSEPLATPPTPSLGGLTLTSTTVSATIGCSSSDSADCLGALTVVTVEHLTGGDVTAISASAKSKKPKKPKKTTRTVTLGTTQFSITAGGTQVVTVKLNATGKKLLAKYHKLPAKLILTSNGVSAPLATSSITIKPSKKKPKHH
jgi:Putative Ig domain